jgi:hypothetical protein
MNPATEIPIEVIWSPLPGSQAMALDSRCHHTLFCGTRGGGKTETQLMRFRKNVGKGYGAFWRGIIFDREYKNLDDIVSKSKKLFNKFGDGARFLASKGEYKWVWPTGEELLLRVAKKDSDYDDYHGHEYPFIGWNELTKQPTSALYDKMMSCNRSSFLPEEHPQKDHKGDVFFLPPIPLEVFSTTNPSGAGHAWVKRRFITCAGGKYGKVVRRSITVFDPKTQQDIEVIKTQVAIFSSFRENRYLDAAYIAELYLQNDPNLKAAWLYGSWDIVAGGAIGDLWNTSCHVLPRFRIPESWHIDRAFDWGSSHPYAVCYFAEANGEEAQFVYADKLYTFCPPPGSLILIGTIYGTREIGTNKGLKHSAAEICERIKYYENAILQQGWISRRPSAGPADNQISNKTQSDEETIEKKMQDLDVYWEKSDKSPGSRINGLQLFRDMLEATIKNAETPRFYVMEHCTDWLELVPSLPRDEKKIDDVDTTSEDHLYDATRYRVLKGSNRLATHIPLTHAR